MATSGMSNIDRYNHPGTNAKSSGCFVSMVW
jgi:hypothetical protein